MALTTDRISVLRGRPPVRAGGRRGFRTAHCWLVRSLGYGFGFIPFLRSRPPFGTDSETNDHDFGSAGAGVVIPHSLYDVGKNKGFIHLNTSHDTSELACDSLAAWWDQQGRADYPQAQKLLVLCDGGGSNSATMYLFKEDLQKLASRLGIEIRVAHYPPYCSKYNPIEHRLFPHLTRACRGVIFHTLETVRYYMAKAETTTGMRVKVSILDKVYATGRKCAAGFKKAMKIVFDSFLPKWNYTAVPEPV